MKTLLKNVYKLLETNKLILSQTGLFKSETQLHDILELFDVQHDLKVQKQLDCTMNYISKIENGTKSISSYKLKHMVEEKNEMYVSNGIVVLCLLMFANFKNSQLFSNLPNIIVSPSMLKIVKQNICKFKNDSQRATFQAN